MRDWKESLDRYLTQEPDSSYDNWVESLIDGLSEDTYNRYYDKLPSFFNTDLEVKWLNRLYGKDLSPDDARVLFERALRLHKPPIR